MFSTQNHVAPEAEPPGGQHHDPALVGPLDLLPGGLVLGAPEGRKMYLTG